MASEGNFTPEERISKAIIDLQKDQPFFADLAMGMQIRKMPADYPMQTMGVDAKGTLYYSDEFVKKTSFDELKGVICHEVCHVAFQHIGRLHGRNPKIANVAQDVVVNMLVVKSNLSLPKEAIPYDNYHDRSEIPIGGKGKGKTIVVETVSEKIWEEVYAQLIKELDEKDGDGSGSDRPGGFDHHDHASGEGMTQQEVDAQADHWRQRMVDAATRAKAQGKLPGGMERMIDELTGAHVHWRELLLRYVKQFVNPVDWAYDRPSRKSQVVDVFLPRVVKESNEVEVIVDTSGSIGQEELSEFLSEIVGMAKSMQHIKMWVTFCDSEVGNRYEVDNGDIPRILAMKPSGGGGTSMEAGLDFIKKHNPGIPVAIVLTDGYDSFNRKRNDYPFDVIWTITDNGLSMKDAQERIPYGMVVKM